jgi:hypothetical protein
VSPRRRVTGITLMATLMASPWTGTTAQRASPIPATAQCPNLSGRYIIQGEDGQVHIRIEQMACRSIKIVRNTGDLGTVTSETHALTLDGTVRADSPWFGSSDKCCETSARFSGSRLVVEARNRGGGTFTVVYSLTAERDVLEEALVNGRSQGPILANR